jgi:hypothetical protein
MNKLDELLDYQWNELNEAIDQKTMLNQQNLKKMMLQQPQSTLNKVLKFEYFELSSGIVFTCVFGSLLLLHDTAPILLFCALIGLILSGTILYFTIKALTLIKSIDLGEDSIFNSLTKVKKLGKISNIYIKTTTISLLMSPLFAFPFTINYFAQLTFDNLNEFSISEVINTPLFFVGLSVYLVSAVVGGRVAWVHYHKCINRNISQIESTLNEMKNENL